MLDQFLQSFSAMMTPVMLTLTLNVVLRVGEGRDVPWSRFLRGWGFILGVAMAVTVAVLRTTLVISRRSYVNYPVLFIAVAADILALVVVLFAQYSKKHRHDRGKRWMIHASNIIAGIAIMMTTFYALQDAFLRLAAWVETGDSPFTTAMMLRVLGFALGIALSFVLAGIVASMRQHEVRVWFTAATVMMILLALVRHAGALFSLLMSTRVLALDGRAFTLMVLVNNHNLQLAVMQIVVYVLPALASIILGMRMYSSMITRSKKDRHVYMNAAESGHAKPESATRVAAYEARTYEAGAVAYEGLLQPQEAHRRILQAFYRKALAVGCWTLVIMACSLSALIVGLNHVNEMPELSPPEQYTMVNKVATIPFEQVSDGHLHRFEYKAADGTVMRFIVIRKHGGAFGLGLDACDICGPTGYYEKDGKIICMRCNVALNVATIGFRGGCNPIPFPFKVHNSVISIQAQDLDALSSHFKA